MSLVLYLEDTDDQRDLVQMMLELHDIKVEVASDGEEGLAMLEKLSPDLVIVDLGMPRINGFEVIQHMKRNPATRHIPIVVLSAWTAAKHMQHAREVGADDFICKPFELETLVQTVLRYLPK